MSDADTRAVPEPSDSDEGRGGYHILRVPSTMSGPCRETLAAYALWWVTTQRDTRGVTQGDDTRRPSRDNT